MTFENSTNTRNQYQAIVNRCRQLFLRKAHDYGTAWQVLRLPSLTDQLFIKAKRIRTLEDTGENKVGESRESEFVGIINYCVIALMLMDDSEAGKDAFAAAMAEPDIDSLASRYDAAVARAWATLEAKNHDYGEAWREMRDTSMTDLILMKLLRIKQLEDNGGPSAVSEGVDANYIDILNYAVFALIKADEAKAAA
jgi:hypothetical protein